MLVSMTEQKINLFLFSVAASLQSFKCLLNHKHKLCKSGSPSSMLSFPNLRTHFQLLLQVDYISGVM